MPREGNEFVLNGLRYFNTYSEARIPAVPPTRTDDDVRAILRVEQHIYDLVGDEREAEIVISFFAYIVRTRDRVNWAILLQSAEGAGKSLLGRFMAAVLGGKPNCDVVNAAVVVEQSFNGWAAGSLFRIVEEIRISGHNRYASLDKLKAAITDDVLSINEKQRPVYSTLNTQSYMLTTNHKNALPLSEGDRRYFVIMSPWQEKDQIPDKAYFDKLFKAIDNHAGALRGWLLDYKLHPDFHPKGRAPESEGRERMRAFSRSDEEQLLRQLIADNSHEGITADVVVVSRFSNALANQNGGLTPSSATLTRVFQRCGFEALRNQVRIKGQLERVRVRNITRWSKDPDTRNSEIRKHIEEAGEL